MNVWKKLAYAGLLLAGVIGAARGDDPADAGQRVFEQRCQGCHAGGPRKDSSLGANLRGIVGTRAGTQSTGVHSLAAIESGIVWDRGSLRRFLSDPQRAMPGTLMPTGVPDAAELEKLLDYLETLR